jgi:hypothetical protein
LGVHLLRRMASLMGAAALAAAAGGCQQDPAADLMITVDGFREETTHRLRCDPVGGDLPRAAAVCDAIAQHRDLFLNPPPNRSICLGGPGVPPGISIKGRYQGEEVDVVGRSCHWPDGLGFAVIEAAVLRPSAFGRAVARLRCGEDPRLLVENTPWSQVRACLRNPEDWGR